MNIPPIKKNDLILMDTGYLQQVEKNEQGEIYTYDSRFSYSLKDVEQILEEIYRKKDGAYVPIYVKGGE